MKIITLGFLTIFQIQCQKQTKSESPISYNMEANAAIQQGRILYTNQPGVIRTNPTGDTLYAQGTTDDTWLNNDVAWIVLKRDQYPELASASNADGDISIAVKYSDLRITESTSLQLAPARSSLPRSNSDSQINQRNTPDLRRTQSEPNIGSSSTNRNSNDMIRQIENITTDTNTNRTIETSSNRQDANAQVVVSPSIRHTFFDKVSGVFLSFKQNIKSFLNSLGNSIKNFLTKWTTRSGQPNMSDLSDATTSAPRISEDNNGALVLYRAPRGTSQAAPQNIVVRGLKSGETPVQKFYLEPMQKQMLIAAKSAYDADAIANKAEIEALWNVVVTAGGTPVRLDDALPDLFQDGSNIRMRVAIPIIFEAATRMYHGLPPLKNAEKSQKQLLQDQPTRSLTSGPLQQEIKAITTSPLGANQVVGITPSREKSQAIGQYARIIRPPTRQDNTDTQRQSTNDQTQDSTNRAEETVATLQTVLTPQEVEVTKQEADILQKSILDDTKKGRTWAISSLLGVLSLSATIAAIVYVSLPSANDNTDPEITFLEDDQVFDETESPSGDKDQTGENEDEVANKGEEDTNETTDSPDNKNTETANTDKEDDTTNTIDTSGEDLASSSTSPSSESTQDPVVSSNKNQTGRVLTVHTDGALGFLSIRPAGAEQAAVDLSRAIQFNGSFQVEDTGYNFECGEGCLRLLPSN